ncbi:hypothetical protein FOZ62_016955, partial [Perkinsus olseni]
AWFESKENLRIFETVLASKPITGYDWEKTKRVLQETLRELVPRKPKEGEWFNLLDPKVVGAIEGKRKSWKRVLADPSEENRRRYVEARNLAKATVREVKEAYLVKECGKVEHEARSGTFLKTAKLEVPDTPPSRDEIKIAIANLPNNKATGEDGLPGEVFKAGGE